MIRCKVCGHFMRLKKENKYLVVEDKTPIEVLTKVSKAYECFNCDKCGCQNFVNIMMLETVGSFKGTERGGNGFGSSGR